MKIPDDFKSPVVVVALMILTGVLILIGAAIAGFDHGVLASMAETGYARGLITYMFSVVTVGTAVVLVLSVLTSEADEKTKERFNRGKEVFSLLLGVFGTVVGFYFGTEKSNEKNFSNELTYIAQPLLSAEKITSGDTIRIVAAIKGGVFPFKYGISIGDKMPDILPGVVNGNGWITTEVISPEVSQQLDTHVNLLVQDSNGNRTLSSSEVIVLPRK